MSKARRLAALVMLAAAAACGPDGGNLSAPVPLDSALDAAASSRVGLTEETGESLSLVVSVSLRNASASRVTFDVPLYCPVIVRLYDPESPSAVPVYDGGLEGCPRAGPRTVEIAPGGRETLMDVVGVQRLRELGVAPGQYRAVATVLSRPIQIDVEAGPVEIP